MLKPFLVLALCFASCATPPQIHEFQKTWTVPSSFDKTWSATVQLFAEHGWPIDTLEKDSGIIVSDWIQLNGSESAAFVDSGNAGLAYVRSREAKFNVFIQNEGANPSLTVNTNFREQWTFDQQVWYQECTSLGVLEARLHEEIVNLVQ